VAWWHDRYKVIRKDREEEKAEAGGSEVDK
jgi:hypothetical protein